MSDIEAKYLTTSDYKKFTREVLETKIKEKGLGNTSNISNLKKNFDLNKNLAKLAAKAKSINEQDKTVNIQPFNSSYLCGKSHFEDDDMQNYLVF